jgi:hypothetical protein
VADYLRRSGNSRVRVLLTPLVSHADLDAHAPIRDVWDLVVFWKNMMDLR